MTVYVASSDTSEGVINRVGDNSSLDSSNLFALSFTTDSWNSPQTVEVTGQWDNLSDGDQSYAILVYPDNTTSDKNYLYVDPEDAVLRNLDLTDQGTFYVSQITGDTDENGQTATFTVRLSSEPNSGDSSSSNDNVTITLSSSDTGEGRISHIDSTAISGDTATLTFTRSNWSAAQTVTLTGQTDNFSDGDQNYTIILSQDNQTTDLKFRYVDPPDVSVKNLDLTGKGGYYVSAVSRDTDENGIQGFFTVSLKSAPTDNVTVYVASSDTCLLYTSPSPRDEQSSGMPSSA